MESGRPVNDLASPAALRYPLHSRLAARLLEWLFWPRAALLPRPAADAPVRKMLIVEPFNLGDAASLSVLLDPLRARFPDAAIHLLVKRAGADLYRDDPRVQRVHEMEFPWARRQGKARLNLHDLRAFRELLRRLRAERFDLGIDTRGEVRNQAIMAWIGCGRRLGFTNYLGSNMHIRGLLLTDSAGCIPPAPRAHMNLALVGLLGCDTQLRLPALHAEAQPPPRPGRYRVLLHTGAGWRFKLWPEARWAELADAMLDAYDIDLRLVGDAGEEVALRAIAGASRHHPPITVTTLPGLLGELAAADLLVCLDSGPMHLAALLDRPTVALFGPGYLAVWQPPGGRGAVVHRQREFACAPCLQKRCIHPGHNCMDALSVAEVLAAVRRQIPAALRREA